MHSCFWCFRFVWFVLFPPQAHALIRTCLAAGPNSEGIFHQIRTSPGKGWLCDCCAIPASAGACIPRARASGPQKAECNLFPTFFVSALFQTVVCSSVLLAFRHCSGCWSKCRCNFVLQCLGFMLDFSAILSTSRSSSWKLSLTCA